MAAVTYYVDTGVSGGTGDGSSWANAYSSWNAFNSAEAANLTLNGDNYTVYHRSSDGSDDTTAVNITGWNCDSVNFLKHICNDDHGGTWDDTLYKVVVANGAALTVSEGGVTIDFMQLELSGINANLQTPLSLLAADNGKAINISRCLMKCPSNATYRENGIALYIGAGRTANVWNCVIYNLNDLPAHPSNVGIYQSAAHDLYLENCTVSGGYNNIRISAGNVYAINNIFESASNIVGTGFDATSNYNSSDKAVTTGGANDLTSQTFTFEAGAGDYRLASGDTGAKDKGTNGVTLGFTDDITGTTRSGTWDIGAHEFVSADLVGDVGNYSAIARLVNNVSLNTRTTTTKELKGRFVDNQNIITRIPS